MLRSDPSICPYTLPCPSQSHGDRTSDILGGGPDVSGTTCSLSNGRELTRTNQNSKATTGLSGVPAHQGGFVGSIWLRGIAQVQTLSGGETTMFEMPQERAVLRVCF